MNIHKLNLLLHFKLRFYRKINFGVNHMLFLGMTCYQKLKIMLIRLFFSMKIVIYSLPFYILQVEESALRLKLKKVSFSLAFVLLMNIEMFSFMFRIKIKYYLLIFNLKKFLISKSCLDNVFCKDLKIKLL